MPRAQSTSLRWGVAALLVGFLSAPVAGLAIGVYATASHLFFGGTPLLRRPPTEERRAD